MHDILANVEKWIDTGETIALATVIQTWGSSPRKVGSHMAFTLSGKITGSVSGGCVENAVIEAGYQVLKSNQPQLLHFGVADETAWEVGLACGGSIEVFVQKLDMNYFQKIKKAFQNEESLVHVTTIRSVNHLLGDGLDINSLTELSHFTESQKLKLNESTDVFIEVIYPSPKLIIVGGVHIAIALVSFAKMLGYQTIVIDPRKAWANENRFPHVDELIQDWVDDALQKVKINPASAIAVLTHDPKIDDPAIKLALNSNAFYVGALGSKATNAKRNQRLLNAGVSESQINKIHAPIGLDIDAKNPEEIALAIMSQIVQVFRKQNQVESKNEANQSPISNSLVSEAL